MKLFVIRICTSQVHWLCYSLVFTLSTIFMSNLCILIDTIYRIHQNVLHQCTMYLWMDIVYSTRFLNTPVQMNTPASTPTKVNTAAVVVWGTQRSLCWTSMHLLMLVSSYCYPQLHLESVEIYKHGSTAMSQRGPSELQGCVQDVPLVYKFQVSGRRSCLVVWSSTECLFKFRGHYNGMLILGHSSIVFAEAVSKDHLVVDLSLIHIQMCIRDRA